MEKLKGYDLHINFHVCGTIIHAAKPLNNLFEAESVLKNIGPISLEQLINVIRIIKLSYDNCDHCKEEIDFLLKR